MWKFLVKNQSIEILEREILADHQISFVQFKFTFEGDWKRFHKVVQFTQGDDVYSIVLGTEGASCYLPAELHVGAAKMSVFGYDTDADTTVRATTVPVTLNIRASGFEGEDTPVPPTPDLYVQLLKRIEEAGGHGRDGKSAYEIAVAHGFTGTEEEWLENLKGKDGTAPDMSEYPKSSEIALIIEREIASVMHSHDNQEVLDRLTPELMIDLEEVQQFEKSTVYNIQTLNEALDNLKTNIHSHNNMNVLEGTTASYTTEEKEKLAGINPESYVNQKTFEEEIGHLREKLKPSEEPSHSHDNKDVLDSLTSELMTDLEGLQQFENSTVFDIQTINDALLSLNAQKHTHDNKAVLDSITEKMISELSELQQFENDVNAAFRTIQESIESVAAKAHTHNNSDVLNGITDEKVEDWDNNTSRIDTNSTSISLLLRSVESLQAQIDNMHPYDSSVTLFRSGADALATYGEYVYTFYNDGYRSISGFAETYRHFCSEENDHALYYNQPDFNWGAAIYTMCTESVHITATKRIMMSYKSGFTELGEMWLVPKNTQEMSAADTARYIYESVQNSNAVFLPFNWMDSVGIYVTVLHDCTNVPTGDYYLAWKSVTDNTHPMIRSVKVLESGA